MSDDNNIEKILDDDELRAWFMSRDPERKKNNPFLTDEAAEQFNGKASSLQTVDEDDGEKVWGISFSEHDRHVKKVSNAWFWVGLSTGLLLAIILALL